MKTVIKVGPTTWRGIHGNAIVDVTDFTPNDPHHQAVPTVREWKQRFGGTQKQLIHPFTKKPFHFDLGPWLHLSEETHLLLEWKFVPDRSVSPTHP
ncbi:MAG: hypothetical protein ABI456_23575 [Ktedonobacteraceae bacterium]